MTSSKWSAHGNVYLLVEGERLTPERARELAASEATDGVLEVLRVAGDEVEIAIWNPDGSRAELSGNGTRIAARWLAGETGEEEVRVRVAGRVTTARMIGDVVEQELGPIEVGAPERVDGIELTPVSVGNPHAVVRGDPTDLARVGPLLESHPRFPDRTNVQVAREDSPGRLVARVWERGVGETASSGTSAVAVAAVLNGEGEVDVVFPGGTMRVRIDGGNAFVTGEAKQL